MTRIGIVLLWYVDDNKRPEFFNSCALLMYLVAIPNATIPSYLKVTSKGVKSSRKIYSLGQTILQCPADLEWQSMMK